MKRVWPWVVVLVLCVAIGAGVPAWTRARVAARYPVTAEDLATGRDDLRHLPVRGQAPSTGYSREQFGEAWADVDKNGCDTRDDVLARDLVAERRENDDCTVLAGTLEEPYTGERESFVRGPDSADVQIDHVVALADAWATGAQQWTSAKRLAFANDPANLLAVAGQANQDKGDGQPATWMPPNHAFWCQYAVQFAAVLRGYGLPVDAPSAAVLRDAAASCPTS
jgi:hypothetical protein